MQGDFGGIRVTYLAEVVFEFYSLLHWLNCLLQGGMGQAGEGAPLRDW